METNNTFKTLMWVLFAIAVVVIGIVLITRAKDKDLSDENVVIGEAVVEDIDIMMLESFPVEVSVRARGYTPDGCTLVGDITQNYAEKTFMVTVKSKRPLDAENCTQALVPFEKTIRLSGVVGLPKGTYTVDVNGIIGTFTLDIDNFISENDPIK